jgi:hypothetical protein
MRFNARKPKGLRSVTLSVDINGRLIKRFKVAGSRRPLTTIRRLPSGRFRVAVIGVAANGNAFEDERTFHRCGK